MKTLVILFTGIAILAIAALAYGVPSGSFGFITFLFAAGPLLVTLVLACVSESRRAAVLLLMAATIYISPCGGATLAFLQGGQETDPAIRMLLLWPCSLVPLLVLWISALVLRKAMPPSVRSCNLTLLPSVAALVIVLAYVGFSDNLLALPVALLLSPVVIISVLVSFRINTPSSHLFNLVPVAAYVLGFLIFSSTESAGGTPVEIIFKTSPLLLAGFILLWIKAAGRDGQEVMEVRGRVQPHPTRHRGKHQNNHHHQA